MAINRFNSNLGVTGSLNRNGTVYTSTINGTAELLQLCTGDAYFASGAQFFRIDVTYGETSEGRQQKRVQHYGSWGSMNGTVSFTPEAKSGLWHLNQIKVFDHDGATKTIKRAALGTSGDIAVNL